MPSCRNFFCKQRRLHDFKVQFVGWYVSQPTLKLHVHHRIRGTVAAGKVVKTVGCKYIITPGFARLRQNQHLCCRGVSKQVAAIGHHLMVPVVHLLPVGVEQQISECIHGHRSGFPAQCFSVPQHGWRLGTEIQSSVFAEIPNTGLLPVAGLTITIGIKTVNQPIVVVVKVIIANFYRTKFRTFCVLHQILKVWRNGSEGLLNWARVPHQGHQLSERLKYRGIYGKRLRCRTIAVCQPRGNADFHDSNISRARASEVQIVATQHHGFFSPETAKIVVFPGPDQGSFPVKFDEIGI